MDIIDLIETLMQTDTEPRDKQSEYLKRHYDESSPYAQQQIDLCFIALCGYSLKTLIYDQKSIPEPKIFI